MEPLQTGIHHQDGNACLERRGTDGVRWDDAEALRAQFFSASHLRFLEPSVLTIVQLCYAAAAGTPSENLKKLTVDDVMKLRKF